MTVIHPIASKRMSTEFYTVIIRRCLAWHYNNKLLNLRIRLTFTVTSIDLQCRHIGRHANLPAIRFTATRRRRCIQRLEPRTRHFITSIIHLCYPEGIASVEASGNRTEVLQMSPLDVRMDLGVTILEAFVWSAHTLIIR
jgi:hypothetical protein